MALSFKTKANLAWAANAPLEIWRVSVNDKGEGKKEKVSEEEIAIIKENLDDLLLSGAIARNDKTRGALLISLNRATAAFSLEPPLPPLELVEKLESNIEEISDLLAKLKKYRGTIEILNQAHTVGDGTIDILPAQISSTAVGGTAFIRMQKMLTIWHHRVKKLPRTVPNAPNDDTTYEIVRYAIEFFSEHSPEHLLWQLRAGVCHQLLRYSDGNKTRKSRRVH
jgi:hypothetical protein